MYNHSKFGDLNPSRMCRGGKSMVPGAGGRGAIIDLPHKQYVPDFWPLHGDLTPGGLDASSPAGSVFVRKRCIHC